jgi:hypothetical protein
VINKQTNKQTNSFQDSAPKLNLHIVGLIKKIFFSSTKFNKDVMDDKLNNKDLTELSKQKAE